MPPEKRWGVGLNKHHKHGRVKSEKKCKEEGWGPGTVLGSEAWSRSRRIVRVNVVGVVVARSDGHGKIEDVSTFPGDVYEVKDDGD